MQIDELPFNRHLGLTLDSDKVVLAVDEKHLNHVGTIHASVLYALAEAATGHALIRAFPELQATHQVLLRGSEAKYVQPALKTGMLTAEATCEASAMQQFRQRLSSRSRAKIEYHATVSQSEMTVFEGNYVWFAMSRG